MREDREKGRLYVCFEHRPLTIAERKEYKVKGANGQISINRSSEARFFAALEDSPEWKKLLGVKTPTEIDPDRTLLGKHLAIYTSKNSFDYFIHKNLGGFLRRELDSYLKSEVISIEGIKPDTPPSSFARDLAQVRAIKSVGEKIIDFIAQIEDFQKRLWLKKKFVLETRYCITLDRIPVSLYPEICDNDAQYDEWKELFAIDDLEDAGERLTPEFLSCHRYLIVDTRHFDRSFVDSLLAELSAVGNLEDQITGVLVHSENFQALNLLRKKYRGQVGCVYIDPPYNTKASEILYKNDYKQSSWLSLLENRYSLVQDFVCHDAVIMTSIDDYELSVLANLLDNIFVEYSRHVIVVNHHPQGAGMGGAKLSRTHEYMLILTSDRSKPLMGKKKDNLQENRSYRRSGQKSNNFRGNSSNSFFAICVSIDKNYQVMKLEEPPKDDNYPTCDTPEGYKRIYPIDGQGKERVWRHSYETTKQILNQGNLLSSRNLVISYNINHSEESRYTLFSNWTDSRYNAGTHGSNLLRDMFGSADLFPYPKSIYTIRDGINASMYHDVNGLVLDYFAGSGTTGHATIDLNREDGGKRKFILVELGHHFDDVLLPRIKKAAYSKEWKDGKPVDREGTTQLFKYIRLESYEDSLDSLTVRRPDELLADHEQYQLRYSLGVETQASAALLGEDFIDPEKYNLSVIRAGLHKEAAVDLAETFNFLLGIRVGSRKRLEEVLVIEGIEPDGERCLILWRNSQKLDTEGLDAWFARHRQSFGNDIRRIYVNGDHALNASKSVEDRWEALVIEPIFRRLMFEDSGERP